jgi:hypothetical protein
MFQLDDDRSQVEQRVYTSESRKDVDLFVEKWGVLTGSKRRCRRLLQLGERPYDNESKGLGKEL